MRAAIPEFGIKDKPQFPLLRRFAVTPGFPMESIPPDRITVKGYILQGKAYQCPVFL
jgi:hypothetical protein